MSQEQQEILRRNKRHFFVSFDGFQLKKKNMSNITFKSLWIQDLHTYLSA